MIAVATLFAILIVMTIALVRAFIGPSLHDRILAVNLFGTKTVLFIAVTAYLAETPEYLDIALVYALINFVSIIGALQYFEQNSSSELKK